jgi:hypothetical protein
MARQFSGTATMKRFLTIAGVLMAIGLIAYAWLTWSERELRVAVEETRRRVRQEGFRTDLSDFNFALSAEATNRAGTISAASEAIRSLRSIQELVPMQTVGTNAALAVSAVEVIETDRATNLWPLLRQELAQHGKDLDRVCAALLTGPIQFQPDIRGDIRLPYVADYKRLAQTLAARSVLAMHERDSNVMFTNLWGLSRMATAWNPEPADICHLVRFSCVDNAQRAIWESMQTECWNEAQLTALQGEWESMRLFDGLPAAAELSCASMVRLCQSARTNSYAGQIGGWGPLLRGCLSSPRTGFREFWAAVQGYRQHARYRDQGSYEDQKALLLYFRDRHMEVKRATACSTWIDMKQLPGITNRAFIFHGATNSRITAIMNLKQLALGAQGNGRSVMARASEAETKRRLIVTAIALERFALQHKEYPRSLSELVPAFLPRVTLDFMDGKALRYRRNDEGRYVLYSIGLDLVDDGGQMLRVEHIGESWRNQHAAAFARDGVDLVWPRPATQADVTSFEHQRPREPSVRSGLRERPPSVLPE